MGNLATIDTALKTKQTVGRMMLALGYKDQSDPVGKNEVYKYAGSVLAEVEKTVGDSKRDLSVCRPDSIVQTMVDAARFRLMIDGRQLAHIVKYGNTATLQIGYRGYIAKIREHFDDADINVFPVYEGDTLEISGGDGFDRYTHKRGNPFADGENGFQGIVAALYYKKGDREFQKVITMSAQEIGKVRKAAKQDYIWSAWFIEKAKAAAVKRICKLQFAEISILQEMLAFDNQRHFDIERPIDVTKAGSIVDNLNAQQVAEKAPKSPEQASAEELPDDANVTDAEFTDANEVPIDEELTVAEAKARDMTAKDVQALEAELRDLIGNTPPEGIEKLMQETAYGQFEILRAADPGTYARVEYLANTKKGKTNAE